MTKDKKKHSLREIVLAHIMVSLFFLGGIYLLLSFGFHLFWGAYSLLWQETKGNILSVGTEVRMEGPDTHDSVCVKIDYSYTVDDQLYKGNRLNYRDYCYATEDEALTSAKRYKGDVSVYYDPLENKRSVLEPGVSMNMVTLLLGIFFTLIGLYGFAYLRREIKPGSHDSELTRL